MKKSNSFFMVLMLATFSTADDAFCQKVWSLGDCIDYALEHSITVRQSQITADQNSVSLNSAQARRLPQVSASASENLSFGRGLTADNTYANTNTSNASFSIGADIPVFQGFSVRNNIEVAKLNLEASLADLEKARDDIRVSVAQAYVQILYNMEILDVAENQARIDSTQLSRLQEMERTGKASQSQVSAQKSTWAQSKLSVIRAEGNLAISLLDLSQLLEIESPDGFMIERPDVSSLELQVLPDPETVFAEAVGVRPSITGQEFRLESAEKNISIAKGSFLPSLSLNGGLGSNYYTSSGYDSSPFRSQLKNNFSQYIGFSLSVPVFSRFSNRNNLRNARLSYDGSALQLESARKSLYKEIQQAYYNALTSESKYEGSLEAQANAQESFRLVAAKYENGLATVTEYNEARGTLLQASSDLAQAKYEYLFQTSLLNFYRGYGLSL